MLTTSEIKNSERAREKMWCKRERKCKKTNLLSLCFFLPVSVELLFCGWTSHLASSTLAHSTAPTPHSCPWRGPPWPSSAYLRQCIPLLRVLERRAGLRRAAGEEAERWRLSLARSLFLSHSLPSYIQMSVVQATKFTDRLMHLWFRFSIITIFYNYFNISIKCGTFEEYGTSPQYTDK